jgi:hypothetical protein
MSETITVDLLRHILSAYSPEDVIEAIQTSPEEVRLCRVADGHYIPLRLYQPGQQPSVNHVLPDDLHSEEESVNDRLEWLEKRNDLFALRIGELVAKAHDLSARVSMLEAQRDPSVTSGSDAWIAIRHMLTPDDGEE